MTQEEKELLIRDLCARLPYGVKVNFKYGIKPLELRDMSFDGSVWMGNDKFSEDIEEVKPYLRPMSSMTEEEARFILGKIVGDREILSVGIGRDEITANVDDGVSSYEKVWVFYDEIVRSLDLLDYLNTRHFDYRGLIEKGLAIEAPEGMYNTKTEQL